MSGRPRKFPEGTVVVSARIPKWKKDILDLHPEVTADQVFNMGADYLLGNLVHNGRINHDGIALLIKQFEMKADEITEKIAALMKLKEVREAKQSTAQIRIWDKAIDEERIIPSSQYDPKLHRVIEEVRAR